MIVRNIRITGRCVFEIASDVLDFLVYELVHVGEYSLEFYNGKR